MVLQINSFQMRYLGYFYVLSMIHKLDYSTTHFHENQELRDLLFALYFSGFDLCASLEFLTPYHQRTLEVNFFLAIENPLIMVSGKFEF